MLLVGLTGGIGSGKSTVAAMLAGRGAVVVDADDLAREAIAPGTPGEAAVRARFPSVVRGGSVDRATLAAIVFGDADARRDLEAIVHPEVRRRFGEMSAPLVETDAVVVFSAPLLVETGAAAGFDVVVVVETPVTARVERLVRSRGMTRDEATARMAAQATDEERAAAADVVVTNAGTIDDLAARVDRLWDDLRRRAAS
ncbi:MAG: dephospho-CoA kinase [Actinomycetota bacterium]